MNRVLLGIALLITGLYSVSRAEPPANVPSDPLSIYRIHPVIDGTVLGIAGLGASVPFLLEDSIINKECYCKPEDVNRFDRYVIRHHSKAASTGSHIIVIAALAGPVIYDGMDVGWNKVYAEDMVVFAQTLAINSAVANIARYGVQRPRPDAYRAPQPVTEPSEFASFYSGHTASVVAGMTAFSMTHTYRYGPKAWPWVLTATAGIADGMLRVFAGRHFYTDVIVGLGAGALVGSVVPMLHHRNHSATYSWMPVVIDRGGLLVWEKRF
jgi:membrane-associated phospholipid phosphatase